MVATFSFGEAYGSPGIVINGSITNINFGSLGSPELDPDANRIARGQNSFEKYIFGSWGGTFTQVDVIQFAMTAGSFGTGEVIKWGSNTETFAFPVTTTSTIATASLPTTLPGSANVSIGGNLAGSLIASPGSSDYMVMQYITESTAALGSTNQKTFTIMWDES